MWKGPDKVTRVSAINYYERGGIKMVDLECMIKSLRLAWLKGVWKSYLLHLIKGSGGLFLFSCNYDFKDYTITFIFYSELLKLWSEFREENEDDNLSCYVIWNNRNRE